MIAFENAYKAAAAIGDLAESIESSEGNGIALAIGGMGSIIENEVNSVPFELSRFDRRIVEQLKHVSDFAYYIGAAVFSYVREENLIELRQLKRNISALFRCVADLQDDLNEEQRFDWDVSANHWDMAANAKRKLQVLRDEQEELEAA